MLTLNTHSFKWKTFLRKLKGLNLIVTDWYLLEKRLKMRELLHLTALRKSLRSIISKDWEEEGLLLQLLSTASTSSITLLTQIKPLNGESLIKGWTWWATAKIKYVMLLIVKLSSKKGTASLMFQRNASFQFAQFATRRLETFRIAASTLAYSFSMGTLKNQVTKKWVARLFQTSSWLFLKPQMGLALSNTNISSFKLTRLISMTLSCQQIFRSWPK